MNKEFSYLYSNDIRISQLKDKLAWVGNCIENDNIPSAKDDKSANNNFNTIAFYFALTKESKSTIFAVNGRYDLLILNFIKKFQYPNMRTKSSFEDSLECKILLAPLRDTVKLLFLLELISKEEAHLSLEEIELFLFYNKNIAKRENYNLPLVAIQIIEYRNSKTLPQSIVIPQTEDEFWNQSYRQLREMINLLTLLPCIIKDNKTDSISFNLKGTFPIHKSELFNILTYNEFWHGGTKEDYFEYMDLKEKYENCVQVLPQNLKAVQQIYYGAPGTGKSYEVNKMVGGENNQNVVRTTFHPDSDYSSFVGCYKPVEKEDTDEITYKFSPQAFTNAYVKAWSNQEEQVFLVIEEINRGNCAQIFGDIFQLLDRNASGESSYSISPDNDLKKYLREVFANEDIDNEEIKSGEKMRLPRNLSICATMNTSDQSLFPIDSAFKRRWDWKYIPISKNEEGHYIKCGNEQYDWWNFLEKVNPKIDSTTGSEDKQLGFWFAKPEDEKGKISAEKFVSKVVFYLWNDVFIDYTTDGNNIFKTDNGLLKFRQFFNNKGDINIETLKRFLDNLGVQKISSNNDNNTISTEDADANE